MPRDYYEVLGVARDSNSDDLRRAYRRLAKVHHPDVNHDDPEAEMRFKEINEAYEVLRDDRKRAMYDRFGHEGVRGSAAQQGGPSVYTDFGDLGDIFEQFFGGIGGQRRGRPGPAVEQGADIRTRLKLSFEEAAFGTTRQVEVVRRERCDRCDGSGSEPGSEAAQCDTCKGSGQVRQVQQSLFGSFVNIRTCPKCRGEGRVVTNACTECSGAGQERRTRTLDVDIPAGVDTGMQIRLTGEGEHGRHGGPPGDLRIDIEVEAHAEFVRDGFDIHLELQINLADAALGADIEVPTLDGARTLRVPPGTQTGDAFRISSLGVPRLRQSGRGDQIVTVAVLTPTGLSGEQRELLEQLRTTLPEAEVVGQDKGGFWDRVREHFS